MAGAGTGVTATAESLHAHLLKQPYRERGQIADAMMREHYYAGRIEEARLVYSIFDMCDITDQMITNSNFVITALAAKGWTVVGTTDPARVPGDKELVICYGNYHLGAHSFPVENKMYRHVSMFDTALHGRFESDPCWDGIRWIYILGLESRPDRIYATMGELCRMNAPLDRVRLYKAKKDEGVAARYIGATKNHVDVLAMAAAEGGDGHVLILEDDFVFSDWLADNKAGLAEFIRRGYAYDICFLSSSRYHQREEHDDLLILSKQECTTSSGYLVCGSTVGKVAAVAREGLDKMLGGTYSHEYVIDRYWKKIMDDERVFIFKKKMGFQRPALSGLTGRIENYLD